MHGHFPKTGTISQSCTPCLAASVGLPWEGPGGLNTHRPRGNQVRGTALRLPAPVGNAHFFPHARRHTCTSLSPFPGGQVMHTLRLPPALSEQNRAPPARGNPTSSQRTGRLLRLPETNRTSAAHTGTARQAKPFRERWPYSARDDKGSRGPAAGSRAKNSRATLSGGVSASIRRCGRTPTRAPPLEKGVLETGNNSVQASTRPSAEHGA